MKPWDTELLNAVNEDNLDKVKQALEQGADIKSLEPYLNHIICSESSAQIFELLIQSGIDIHLSNDLLICTAAEQDNKEIVELLLQYGASPTAWGCAPIAYAIENHYTETFAVIITNIIRYHKEAIPEVIPLFCENHIEIFLSKILKEPKTVQLNILPFLEQESQSMFKRYMLKKSSENSSETVTLDGVYSL